LRLPAHDAGTGLIGRPLGKALRGFDFVFDSFDAYAAGLVSNPNMIVAGSIGAGKSTVVKMLLDRALTRGRRVVVIDPKGEYQQLAASHGVSPVTLGRHGWCSPFPDDDREGRNLLRHSAQRSLALTLYRFIHGDLAGLFDGDGDPLVFSGQLIVLDLSVQWSSNSLSVAALSAVAAAQQVVATEGELGYLVLDEAWALLSDDHALRWLQGSWKLARSRGLSHILVLHRWTDVAAAGDAGSAQRERAQGLLRECETALLFRQPPDEAREMSVALGLHEREEQYLTALPKGAALVRYGAFRSVVRVIPDDRDRRFIDTDSAMREHAAS
jgi:type IV secretory pathway VirB4 component